MEEAITYGRAAYALDPESGFVTEYVAGWYTDLGAKEEALVWTKRQLEVSPGNYGVWFSAGYSLVYLGEASHSLRNERCDQ